MLILEKNIVKIKLFFVAIIFLFLIGNISAIIISEIMYNPPDSLGGQKGEWIELYNPSTEDFDINGWKIADPSNHSITEGSLMIPANGFLVIVKSAFFDNFSNYYSLTNFGKAGFGLNNDGEEIQLLDSTGIIHDSKIYSNDLAYKNNKTLQYCSGSWIEAEPTPGSANNCAQECTPDCSNRECGKDGCGGNCGDCNNEENCDNGQCIVISEETNQTIPPENETSAPSIELNYPSEIGLEQEFNFKIKLIGFDPGLYDVKIDILSEGNRIAKILNNDTWKSTIYYINDIITPDKEKEFSMKIVEDFKDAEIEIKIRDSSDKSEIFSGYLISKSNETNILLDTEQEVEDSNEISDTNSLTGNVVSDTKDIKSENNYKKLDKNDYAKYGIIGFCILLLSLFLFKIKLHKKEYKNEFN